MSAPHHADQARPYAGLRDKRLLDTADLWRHILRTSKDPAQKARAQTGLDKAEAEIALRETTK